VLTVGMQQWDFYYAQKKLFESDRKEECGGDKWVLLNQ